MTALENSKYEFGRLRISDFGKTSPNNRITPEIVNITCHQLKPAYLVKNRVAKVVVSTLDNVFPTSIIVRKCWRSLYMCKAETAKDFFSDTHFCSCKGCAVITAISEPLKNPDSISPKHASMISVIMWIVYRKSQRKTRNERDNKYRSRGIAV